MLRLNFVSCTIYLTTGQLEVKRWVEKKVATA